MTIYALGVNGYEGDDQVATKVAEVKSDEDGTVTGDYFADPFVENPLVIELNTCLVL